jgi:hypothetical protein
MLKKYDNICDERHPGCWLDGTSWLAHLATDEWRIEWL